MTTLLCRSLVLLCILVESGQAESASPSKESIHFGRDIQPILANRCYKCHGPDAEQRQAEFRLDQFDAVSATSIVPGDADQSPLYQRITDTDPEIR
ncbi:MAG: c-type cytochrome domain-containing protein, partial [Planctomycetota bacterium]|nr:c-type cytochrome domain-containing protein [Planctomycetota bacterium]